jgi:hypothetical protein
MNELRDRRSEGRYGNTRSLFNDGYLVPNREQRVTARAIQVANLQRDLLARVPPSAKKSVQNQHHTLTHFRDEELAHRMQFDTGLTGTPYATDRSINSAESACKFRVIASAL